MMNFIGHRFLVKSIIHKYTYDCEGKLQKRGEEKYSWACLTDIFESELNANGNFYVYKGYPSTIHLKFLGLCLAFVGNVAKDNNQRITLFYRFPKSSQKWNFFIYCSKIERIRLPVRGGRT